MNNLLKIHIENGNFHHGYLLAGDPAMSRGMAMKAAEAILSPEGKLETHPDFSFQKFDLFGIDDSHELRRMASQRPFAGDNKVFIIEISSFSMESANALLKLFEEPYEGTHFFVITPSLEDVIPTLRSRLTIIDNTDMQKVLDEEKMKFYEKFLKDLPNKRLESIKNIIKDRKGAINFLNELEMVIHKKLIPLEARNEVSAVAISDLLLTGQKCRDFLYQKGSSAKMILEHIALSLPQM